jgi:biotin carboxylase
MPEKCRGTQSQCKILILGASYYQMDAIKQARALGFTVFTTDNRPENPGHSLADRSFSVDTVDLQGVLALSRAERVDGLLAPCTDVAQPVVAEVAALLNLRAPALRIVLTLCSKKAFRAFQRESGLPHPPHLVLDDARLALPRICPFEGPWIVKPLKSSGSRGVRIIDKWSLVDDAVRKAREASLDGGCLVERFLDGSQHTCEGVMKGGEIEWAVVTTRFTADPPYSATLGHEILQDSQMSDTIRNAVQTMWRKLGYSDGVFDADIVVHRGVPILLEATARLGGNCMGRLIKHATGNNIVRHAILEALDVPITRDFTSTDKPAPTYVRLVASPEAGIIQYDPACLETAKTFSQILEAEIDLPPGARVPEFTNGRCRLGHTIGHIPADSSGEAVHANFLSAIDYRIVRSL